ncbi:MAG: hypothetical protein AAF667_11320 [Pseudomonadota bacterium]
MTPFYPVLTVGMLALGAGAETARAQPDVTARPVAEIVTFRLADGVTEAQFLAAAALSHGFLQRQPGFIRRRMSRADNDQWTDYVEWRGMGDAEAAGAALMETPAMEPFLQALDPASVRLRHETLVWALDGDAETPDQ